jgi:hypothetical protein
MFDPAFPNSVVSDNTAPAPIGQEAQPAADRRAYKAVEAVTTRCPWIRSPGLETIRKAPTLGQASA